MLKSWWDADGAVGDGDRLWKHAAGGSNDDCFQKLAHASLGRVRPGYLTSTRYRIRTLRRNR